MRLSSILGISWDELSDKLLKDFLFRARHFVSSLILTLTNSHGDNLVDLNIGGNSEQVSQYNVRSVSGTAVRVDDSYAGNIKNIVQYGQCIQNGIPTSEEPVAITGKVAGTTVYSKNLFDKANVQFLESTTITQNEDGFTLAGKWYVAFNVSLSPGTYYLSGTRDNNLGVPLNLYSFYADHGAVASVSVLNTSVTLTQPVTRFIVYVGSGTDASADFHNMQLESGSSATAYEPYVAQTQQTVTDSNGDPVTLYGIPVTSGGNVVIDGQQYIADTLAEETVTRMVGHIASYNGETITTAYMSNKGELSTGADVYYALAMPTTETVTVSPATLYSNAPTTTWLSEAHSSFELPVTGQGNVTLPNPSWPVPIENVGTLMAEGEHVGKYAVPVKVSGKNLFPQIATDTDYANGSTVRVNQDGSISIHKVAGKNIGFKGQITIAAGAYTLSTTNYYSTSGCYIQVGHNFYTENRPKTRTLDEGTYAIYVFSPNSYEGEIILFPQLELGSSVTAYEPYHEPVTTTLYLDEPLRKGDILEVVGGTLVKRRQVEVFDGVTVGNKLTSVELNSNNTFSGWLYDGSLGAINSTPICTHFVGSASTALGTVLITSNGRLITFRHTDQTLTTVNTWNSYLAAQYEAGTPVTVEYELETPVTINLAGQTIPTFEGTTIITVDTDPEPETMTATYWQEG